MDPNCPDQDDISVAPNADGWQPQTSLDPLAEHGVVAARAGHSAARKADRCRSQVGVRINAPPRRSPTDERGGGRNPRVLVSDEHDLLTRQLQQGPIHGNRLALCALSTGLSAG